MGTSSRASLVLVLFAAACGGASAPPVSPEPPPTASATLPPPPATTTPPPVVPVVASASSPPADAPPPPRPWRTSDPAWARCENLADDKGLDAVEKADDAFKKEYAAKTSHACEALAEEWGYREILVPESADRAADSAALLKKACDRASAASACMGYALMRKYGTATGKRDDEGAKPYFKRLRDIGDLQGFKGEPPSPDGKAAVKRAEKECNAGSGRACATLAWAAWNGVQREKSTDDTFKLYEKSCNAGSLLGCRWAGHFAHEHPEIGQSPKAKGFLDKACVMETFPAGCDQLGEVLVADNPKKNGPKALELFEKACDEGVRGACLHAGKLLKTAGFAGSTMQAADYLKRACDAGEKEACDLAK